MPIGPELLNPIPGENPAGANLRYDPVYDKIKEARREDTDTANQGEWTRELKKADSPLVIKLCSDLLTNKTKDLQLAAWLTEALVRRENFLGLQQGLDLCRGLVEQFWDNLYPEAEDGEYESRATPLEWVGGRLGDNLKKISLTKSGLDWFQYKESRTVGYEADVASSDNKREAREQAIADGKLTPEEFDKAFDSTPKTFYQNRLTEIDACTEAVDQLSQACEGKFGEFNPSFSALRESLETIRQAVNVLLAKKRETEPDEGAEQTEASGEEEAAGQEEEAAAVADSGSGAPARAKGKKVVTADPADRPDAYVRVAALATWLRKEDPYNPVPYVMVRSMRWGELRANGSDIDANLLEPPSTAQRTEIKRLYNEGNYDELFPLIEAAAAEPCGRGWLDLQRFFCNACDNAGGYDYVKNAVIAELKALLSDYPDLTKMTMLDDTPTANPETLAWLEPILHREPAPSENQAIPDHMVSSAGEDSHGAGEAAGEAAPPDVYELAKQAVKRGHTDEAIGLLAREAALERCGRARFLRQVQLAQICLSTNHEVVAYPILQGLSDEIESRKLEGWEQPELLAQALSLLFRCGSKLKEDPEFKQQLYARICRLDPMLALDLKQ
jgi:type VI secretion system protein ImpA